MFSPARLLGIILTAAVLVTFVVFGLSGTRSANGRLAPALPTTPLSGQPVTLAGLKGKPAIVIFWASWCGPCAHEAPALARVAQRLGSRAHMVGVNWSDVSVSDAKAFIRRYGWTFPNLRDAEGTAGNNYGIISLPTTFLIDSDGHIRQTLRGPQTEQALDRALATLMRG
ncbi:MAG TPA: TlpA disulfide reductase family protein [Solirubrobacteraceae bacterium]|jgi:peroxiredoxin